MVVGQIIIILMDIFLVWRDKNTEITKIAKAVIYFLKGDIVASAYMLVDTGQEIVFEERKRFANNKVWVVLIVGVLLLCTTLGFNKYHLLPLSGILSAMYFSCEDNKKSTFNHFVWFVYNITMKNYLLAVDEFVYMLKKFKVEMDISEQEWQKEKNNNNDVKK